MFPVYGLNKKGLDCWKRVYKGGPYVNELSRQIGKADAMLL